MPIINFDDNDNYYEVTTADAYVLNFYGGVDTLIDRTSGSYVVADMGDDNDAVLIDALGVESTGSEFHINLGDGDDAAVIGNVVFAEVFGGAGEDQFIFWDNCEVFLDGGNDDDSFWGYGNAISGQIFGGSGDDGFDGFTNSGTDLTLYGGVGDDWYLIGNQNMPNIVEYANEGTDYLSISGPASYTMSENIEVLHVFGLDQASSTDFTITAAGNTNNVIHTAGLNADAQVTILGDATVFAGAGNDTVTTGVGNDVLNGEAGNDTLSAGNGADTLKGGAGRDTMTGGAGSDFFVFNSVSDSSFSLLGLTDKITDYQANLDIIDLHNIDANANLPGNQAFNLYNNPTGAAGQLWIVNVSYGNFKIYADVNGGGADFVLEVHMNGGNSASDMIFSY